MSARRRPGGARKMKAFSRIETMTSEGQFDRALKRKDQLILVEFLSNYSPSSKSMAPYMQQISRLGEFKRIRLLRVDIEAVPAVAEKCNVKALPTYQIYKNGEKLEEMSGALPSKLVAMLKEHNFKPKKGGLKKVVGVVLGITFGVVGLFKLKAGVEAAEKAAEERKELEKRAAEERARRERDALRQQRARARGITIPQEEEEQQFEDEDEDEEYEYYDDDEDE